MLHPKHVTKLSIVEILVLSPEIRARRRHALIVLNQLKCQKVVFALISDRINAKRQLGFIVKLVLTVLDFSRC